MYSHPGKELKEHLYNVKELGKKIFEDRNTKWKDHNRIKKTLDIILETHDYGKATCYFQEYIQDPSSIKYQKSPYKTLKAHGELSALWTYYLIMTNINNLKLAVIGYMLVNKHHGNITNFEKKIFIPNDEEILKRRIDGFDFDYFNVLPEKDSFLLMLEEFKKFKFSMEIRKIIESFTIEDYILCNFLFSILISADKGEAIFYSKGQEFEKLQSIKDNRKQIDLFSVDKYKEKKFGSPKNRVDEIREDIYKEVEKNMLSENIKENRIFSINVPTGTGKTLTSLNAALKLRKRLGGNHRIVYTLPFTSVIDQNFKVFSDVFGKDSQNSSVLLKHHYLAEKEYKTSEDEFDYGISEYFIENWDSEIIVTTFVQLLTSLLTNRNRRLKKFHNIAESIIILDEVQSIPYKYWKLINNLLKSLTKTLNCYVILITATMPLIFNENKNEIIELAKKKEEYFSFFDRITLDISNIDKKMNIDDFCDFALHEIEENNQDSFLFVFNTVKTSLKLYEVIKKEYPKREIVYLSTNIIPKERLDRIEEKIKKIKNVIVISTQLIEAGVDIDIDRVYRDFGPLDSINQVCGRCNRNGVKQKKGIVKLVKLIDTNNQDKLFSSYVYKSQLLEYSTNNTLNQQGKIITEKDFFSIAKKYFNNIENGKSDEQSDKLLEHIWHLQYSKAFDYSKENKDTIFELISQDFKTIDLFIMIDETAEQLWNKYQKIYKNKDNNFGKKELFNKIKSDFLSYVISVPEKFYPEGKEGFNLIDNLMLEQYYSHSTGFIRSVNQKDYFF